MRVKFFLIDGQGVLGNVPISGVYVHFMRGDEGLC